MTWGQILRMPTLRGRKNGYSLGGGVFTLKSSKKAFKKVKMDDSVLETNIF